MTILIRPAAPPDTPVILRFIEELAAYERLAGEVKITLADIRAILFAPGARAFCDIAQWDGEAVGFALWFYSFSSFEGRHGLYLEDLYVSPAARGTGVGKALMAALARRCVDEGLARLEWAVLDWNAPAIGFYDTLGATAKTEWITRTLRGATLEALAAA